MVAKTIIGWLLLLIGLLIIAWAIWSAYGVFTGQKAVPEIFSPASQEGNGGSGSDIERQIQQTIQEQLKNILPAETLPQLLNMIAWSIFMGILIMAGGKISGIGIKLMKKSD